MLSNSLAKSLLSLSLPLLAQAFKHRLPVTISELRKQVKSSSDASSVQQAALAATYPAYTIATPVDHFHNDSLYEPHSNATFNLNYYFDAQYYKPGGPVIVLNAGEDAASDRLPYLEQGIVSQLANATNGIGVILEHRYYGESWPVLPLTTENLRFLTTDQALADTAYFAQNVMFPGFEDQDLTSNTTPYIAYGGSYAGALVAILRKQYPDVYWGSIASSGVTEAIYDYWQYYDAAAIYGPPTCIEYTQKITNVVDNILIGKNGTAYPAALKKIFGLSGVLDDGDFATTISAGISGLQGYNWDPSVTDNEFWTYCDTVSNETVLYPLTEEYRTDVEELIAVGGWGNETTTLVNQTLNYIGYVRRTASDLCQEEDQNECFKTVDTDFFSLVDPAQAWKSWPYQYCTQWGYLTTGSGVPADQLPLISRTIDIPYSSAICSEAFNITTPSDVEAINKYGGFNISYPRLAIIDGEWDPWRAATPHALGLAPRPTNSTDEPFILISEGVHHWDENGLPPSEVTAALPPTAVKSAQLSEAEFVTQWVAEFHASKASEAFKMENSRIKSMLDLEGWRNLHKQT